jgi:hypothetical protein
MKKLILLLLFFPTILFAQIVNNRYKFSLATNNLRMELASGNFIRVADDCRDRTPGCGSQVWFVAGVRGKPNVYQITLIASGKYLTWNDGNANAIKLEISLQPRYPTAKSKYQQFIFVPNDKGGYQIQPAMDAGITNDYYLGATLTPGAHNAVGVFKNGETPIKDISNTWFLAPPVTPLPVQESPNVVVSPPSDNKLDVDFKTGGDNLEMKPFQDNVEIRIILQNRADAVLVNANKDQNWPNNSIKRVSIPLPANISVSEIKEIHVYRKRKLGGTPGTTIFNVAEKDNWNVDKISATARLKVDGILKSYKFPDFISPLGSSHALFRFVYEGGDGKTEGQFFKGVLGYMSPDIYPRTAAVNPLVKIETLTGGDDLRGGNDNVNLLIRLKIRPVRNIAVNNLNNGQNWGNFTEHATTRTLSVPPFTFDDIEDIVVRHTGGGGIGADNWYLDKLKITLTIAGETRVLVDQVNSPIHYFKGDSRSKIFPITH